MVGHNAFPTGSIEKFDQGQHASSSCFSKNLGGPNKRRDDKLLIVLHLEKTFGYLILLVAKLTVDKTAPKQLSEQLTNKQQTK